MPHEEPLVERVKKMALNLQFLWFVGHLITVIHSALTVVRSGTWGYYKAYYGTILSYGIILYKAHHTTFGFTKEFLARLLQDENAQYGILALVWATGAPIKVTLIPYAIFSLFHSIGFLRTEFIPKILPVTTQGTWVSEQIKKFMDSYQPLCITMVGRAEVWVILPMSIVGVFWGGSSIFTPFLFIQFLQFRYLQSPATKQALAETQVFFDKWILGHPSVPPSVKTVYEKTKELIFTYGNLEERARKAQSQEKTK